MNTTQSPQPEPTSSEYKGAAAHLTESQVLAAIEGRTIAEAAAILGISHANLHYHFSHLWNRKRPATGIPSLNGGKCHLNAAGYILEHAPDHPCAYRGGYMLQHRLAVEKAIGRYLKKTETIHHIDHNKQNNAPENLEILSRSEHGYAHADEKHTLVPLSENDVRIALADHTTLQAAEVLGVNHQTLRNRFGHLLNKRKTPADPNDPAVESLIRQYAADPNLGYRELAHDHGICSQFAKDFCETRGIVWMKKKRDYRKKTTPNPPERDAA